jgi:hypothetical protein
MTQEHIKFPSIEQFRSVVRNAPKQTIKFTGTVKLHGTNASIVMRPNDVFYAQSRERIITPENDNYGFAKFAHDNRDYFERFKGLNNVDEYVIYGEWCGKGIQKGVGISDLEKMFVIFALKINGEWANKEISNGFMSGFCDGLRSAGVNIYCIHEFPTFEIDIDFNYPELSVNKLSELTEQVEKQCPVAKAFDIDGVGEGIVWNNDENNLIFKVKGEKHSVSKVKTLAPVDVEKLNSIKEFLDYALTENRLLQAQSVVTPDLDIKKMGDFIRWVFNDIIKEESDTLSASGLDQKDIGKAVSAKSRQWFQSQLAY